MKRILTISAFVISTAFGVPAMAGQQGDAVIGAAVGGGAGALIGNSVNGRNGALIGSAIGAITGVAIATADREPVQARTVVYAPPERERVVVYRPQPVVIQRYEPPRMIVVDRKPGHGYGRGWKRDYAWNDHGHDGHGRWH